MPAMSTPHTQPPALTGFLGLPSELRLRIYGIILSADLDAVDFEKFQWFAYGTSKLELPSVRLPITNLAQSCRLVANEVRDHIGSQPAKDRFATMSMQASLKSVEPSIMRQITCKAVYLVGLRVAMNLTISRFDVFTFGLGLSIPSIAAQRYTPVIAGLETQLHSLFRYDSLLRGSGLLDEIQILLHLSIQQDRTRTGKKHD